MKGVVCVVESVCKEKLIQQRCLICCDQPVQFRDVSDIFSASDEVVKGHRDPLLLKLPRQSSKVDGVADLLCHILQVPDGLVVCDVRRRVLGEQNEDRDERKDNEVACVEPLPSVGSQVDGVQPHLHGVGGHEGGRLGGVRRRGGADAELLHCFADFL